MPSGKICDKISTMKNERILIADDASTVRQGVEIVVKTFGEEDGHRIVGSAESVSEVETFMESGLKPTVALVDGNFPNRGDGEKAAEIIKRFSPNTVIIAFSSDPQNYGDFQWNKHQSGQSLIECLTNLQH